MRIKDHPVLEEIKNRKIVVITVDNDAIKHTLSKTPSVGDAISISDAVIMSVAEAAWYPNALVIRQFLKIDSIILFLPPYNFIFVA